MYAGSWRSTDADGHFSFNVPGGIYAMSLEYFGAFGDDTVNYHDSRLLNIFPGSPFSITIDPTMIGVITTDNEIDTISYNVRYEVTGTVDNVEFVNASHSGQNNNCENNAALPWSYSFVTKNTQSFDVSARFRDGDTGMITTAVSINDVCVYPYKVSCSEGRLSPNECSFPWSCSRAVCCCRY